MTEPTASSTTGRLRPEHAAAGAVLVVFAIGGLVQLLGSWPAVGDFAVAELIVRHFGRHLPLSGPYSAQRGYNHPLPLIYWLLWPAYVLSGGRSTSEVATAVWWNGASAALLVWILVRRRFTGLALLAVLALPLLAAQQGRNLLVLPWNPNLGLVPALALVFVCWRIALGERRLLPLGAVLAVWCVGVHLGYLPLVGVLGLLATVALLVRTVRNDGRAGLRTLLAPLAAATAITALLASPAALDVALHRNDSNPMQVIHKSDSTRVVVPASQARKVLQSQLSIPPAWARSEPPYDYYLLIRPFRVPWLLVPIALATAGALRRKAWDELTGIGLSLAGLLVACAELIHLADIVLQPWYLYPGHAAGIALCAFTLWSLLRSVGAIVTARPPRRVVALATPVAFAVAATLLMPSLRTPKFHNQIETSTARLVEAIRQEIPAGSRLVVTGPIRFDGYYTQTLVLQLDKAGYAVRVPQEDRWQYTEAMTKRPAGWDETARSLLLTTGDTDTEPPAPGARLLITEHVAWAIVPNQRTMRVWLMPGQ